MKAPIRTTYKKSYLHSMSLPSIILTPYRICALSYFYLHLSIRLFDCFPIFKAEI